MVCSQMSRGTVETLTAERDTGQVLPTIMIAGSKDVSMAAQAMKAGASDFIEKPVSGNELPASVTRAGVVAGFDQAVRLARERGEPHCRPDAAPA
jgi:FixJ family two-component response regulator